MLLARILSLLGPLAVIGWSALLIKHPTDFFQIVIIGSLLLAFSVFGLLKMSPLVKGVGYFFYLLTGWLLYITPLALFILLENFWLKIILGITLLVLLVVYYDGLFIRLIKKPFQNKQLSENWYFNFWEVIIVLFSAVTLFGLKDFLNYQKLWFLAIIFLLSWVLSQTKAYSQNQPIFRKNWPLYLSIAVINTEIFWAISSLPLVYYVKGLLFTFLYLVFCFYRDSVYDKFFDKKTFKTYLVVLGIIVLLVLLTARWF